MPQTLFKFTAARGICQACAQPLITYRAPAREGTSAMSQMEGNRRQTWDHRSLVGPGGGRMWVSLADKSPGRSPGLLTRLDGGLPPQQELEALGVVRQAAVVQGGAALPRLLIQVPTGQEQGQRKRKVSESQARGPALPSQAGAWAREQERQQAVEPPSGGFLATLLRGGGSGL